MAHSERSDGYEEGAAVWEELRRRRGLLWQEIWGDDVYFNSLFIL